jgi:hypothetical protein
MDPKAKQRPRGMWFIEFQNVDGKRRRISTGIKTPKMRTPPPEVRARIRDTVLEIDPATHRRYKGISNQEAIPEPWLPKS